MMSSLKKRFATRISEVTSQGDRGISLPEVLIAIGLSGLLALGCTQLAMASFTSANYTQDVAVKSLNSGNLNRIITTDMEHASGFIASSEVSARNSQECSTAAQAGASVKPLLTMKNIDGTYTGYEVRTTTTSGALWRINCLSAGVANGSSQMLRNSLPVASSAVWNTSMMCARFPVGGSLTTFECDKNVLLADIKTFPGVFITIPQTLSSADVLQAEQIIIAARNFG
jgi:Tfp pilus assembly protein PilW